MLRFGLSNHLLRQFQLREFWILEASCALLVLIFAVTLTWASFRLQGSALARRRAVLGVWGLLSAGVSWVWFDWYAGLLL